MNASNTSGTPTTHMSTSGELPGLHGRLTVIPANPDDRAAVTEQLARLLERARTDAPTTLSTAFGPADFDAASREAAVRRVENSLKDSTAHQLGKPIRQDVPGDAQPRLEFLKMVKVVEGAADDQEGPLFADQLDGSGQWTLQRLLAELIDRGRDLALGQSCCTPLDDSK